MKISILYKNLCFSYYQLKLFLSQCSRQVQPSIVVKTILSLFRSVKTTKHFHFKNKGFPKCFSDFSCSSRACSWTFDRYLRYIFWFFHNFQTIMTEWEGKKAIFWFLLRGFHFRQAITINALSEWIIGIDLHEFTKNKQEISYRTRPPSAVLKTSSSLLANECR